MKISRSQMAIIFYKDLHDEEDSRAKDVAHHANHYPHEASKSLLRGARDEFVPVQIRGTVVHVPSPHIVWCDWS